MKPLPFELASLSAEERLDLIERLWDSLATGDELPVTAAQRRELRSRMAALERGEMKTLPLDQVLTAIRADRATRQP
jgi:putative addiction module component (TIGR02574 family)